jgi:GNAT superfamily N-acetyltransferase
LLDDDLIGMGACCDGSASIGFKKGSLYLNLGISKGKKAYNYFKNIFEERDYAFEIDNECGMIEFVAVDESYRNKKVGYTLINHMMCDNKYKRYMAKVGNNNYSARKLLDNIEFEEFDIEQSKIKEKEDVGVDNYFYMICENPKLRSKIV